MARGERFNSITHLVGAVGALAGLTILVVVAARSGDPWRIVSFSVYGTTLLLLYTTSTLYHSLSGRAKDVFQRLDHVSIYLLIAGTYTPFTLVAMRGTMGWVLFGLVWGLAITGTLLDSMRPVGSARPLQLVIYLAMGWAAMVGIRPLIASLPAYGFRWLLVGGLFYTVGIVFYLLGKRMRHAHGIWHLFVLGGSASHFGVILGCLAG